MLLSLFSISGVHCLHQEDLVFIAIPKLSLKDILEFDNRKLTQLIKKKNQQKPWETLIISENLSWDEFSKKNFYLHELAGAKPVITVGRSYQ